MRAAWPVGDRPPGSPGTRRGGHTGRIGTLALLPLAIDAAAPCRSWQPGGSATGEGWPQPWPWGGVGAWVGTRFLATNEGGALPVNKKHILDSNRRRHPGEQGLHGKTLRASYNKYHDLWDGSGLEPLAVPTQVPDLLGPPGQVFIEGKKEDYVGGLAGQVSA